MSLPTDPTVLPHRRGVRQRMRGFGTSLRASRRRAAVVTSAALLSAGALATLAPDSSEAAVAPHAPIAAVSSPAVEAEPSLLTLLPADTAEVPIARVSDVDEAAGTFLTEGRASYYGRQFAGNPTASGERFDPTDLTAAHRTLPFGTRVRVTNLRNGKSVIVRVNDRGPFHEAREIDVSRAAADEIGMTQRGTARVRLDVLPTTRAVRG